MLIRSFTAIFSLLLFFTHISAKSGRRKGILRQPPEFETWTGKWFPFDPTYSTTTTTTTTTTPPLQSAPTSAKSPNDDLWSGRWFPFDPKSSKSTTSTEPICDDGKSSIGIDFDPTDKRHSYNFLCLTKKREIFKPNLNVEAIEFEQVIPPAYVPPIKCLNESITYEDLLPTFGSFRPLPPKYGTYRYLPPQRWLRSVTEGAVVMLYHPCAFPGQVKLLENTLKSCLYRHIITTSQSLSAERPLALIAWGKSLQMSVVDERTVVNFIKSNAKSGPLPMAKSVHKSKGSGTYEVDLITEAKLITDLDDTEICGYKEM